MIILIMQLIGVLIFFFYMLFAVTAIIKGAPYIRTKKASLEAIVHLMPKNKDLKILDLGSGDGQVMLALKRNGYLLVDGIEIQPFLVLLSGIRLWIHGYNRYGKGRWGNMWRVDTSGYDVIIVYGFPTIMRELYQKIKREQRAPKLIISNSFQIQGVRLLQQEGNVYTYLTEE